MVYKVEILRISPLKYRSFSIAVSSLSVPMYASRSSADNFRSKSPYPFSAFEGSSSFLNLSYPLFYLRTQYTFTIFGGGHPGHLPSFLYASGNAFLQAEQTIDGRRTILPSSTAIASGTSEFHPNSSRIDLGIVICPFAFILISSIKTSKIKKVRQPKPRTEKHKLQLSPNKT